MRKRIALAFSSVLLVLVLASLADHLVGWVSSASIASTSDLVLPSYSHLRHTTSEFTYDVEVNSLGFRDREFGPKEDDVYRIVALGDSFTYGWGVEIEQSWPKILERELAASGMRIEVANLGRGGQAPADYADFAERAIPHLKPDLVIVGVLQGDDLEQSSSRREMGQWKSERGLDQRLFPNTTRIIHKWKRMRSRKDLSQDVKGSRDAMLASLDQAQRARFDALDREVRSAVMEGGLNPSLLGIALKRPRYLIDTQDLEAPESIRLISNMAWEFSRIRSAAELEAADVMILAIPYGAYVSKRALETRRRLGFEVDDAMLRSDAADEAIRSAATSAGLDFVAVTRAFREASLTRELYFKWDGHFNLDGQQFFAEQLAPLVRARVEAGASR